MLSNQLRLKQESHYFPRKPVPQKPVRVNKPRQTAAAENASASLAIAQEI
ncbi:hypothetical protein [Chroococcidiopsis sp.]